MSINKFDNYKYELKMMWTLDRFKLFKKWPHGGRIGWMVLDEHKKSLGQVLLDIKTGEVRYTFHNKGWR